MLRQLILQTLLLVLQRASFKTGSRTSPGTLVGAVLIACSSLLSTTSAIAEDRAVNITPDLGSVTVQHDGKDVIIECNQDQNNTVNEAFAKTSRKCPPFCIQPSKLAEGVETVGEVELVSYIKAKSEGDDSVVINGIAAACKIRKSSASAP